ncbi:F-box protein-like protein [Drosera capensis]
MEIGRDLLDSLDHDMSLLVLNFLDDPSDIVRVGSVSRGWRDFVISNSLCRQLCIRLFPQLSCVVSVVDLTERAGMPAEVGTSRSIESENEEREHRVYASLARGLISPEVDNCVLEAISASTTDNYPEESIHNTLEARDRVGRRASYWSSSGQSNPAVPEKLIYKLQSDFYIVTEISVQPFQAFFQPNSPIYSAKSVRFRMGHPILSYDSKDFHMDGKQPSDEDFHMDGKQPSDDKFVWTYTSQEFPMAQENRLQIFQLPQPALCIGGFLMIELLGRVQRQEMDGLLYICVAHVQVVGRSLSPVFGVECHKPCGKFVLRYNPKAKYSSPGGPEDPDYTQAAPEVMHVRGLEQILNFLRGTLGGEVYDSDNEHYESDDDDDEMEDQFIA